MPKPKKDAASFRAQFDKSVIIPTKLREGLADLAKKEGAEAWETENDFFRRAGVANVDGASFRDEFAPHIVEARNKSRSSQRIWFADAKLAKSMREKIGG